MTAMLPARAVFRSMILVSAGTATVCLSATQAQAATHRVGPGRAYAKLQDVVSLLSPGDVVEVDGNVTYPGGVTFTRPGTVANRIVIRGLRVGGKRPVLLGGTNTVHFRTDNIGSGADHYVMEGFEITGGSSRCVFHQSHDLTLSDVAVHDCPSQGILGADWGSGSLTIEHSEVYRCGGGTQDHQVYIGMDEDNHPGGVFRLQHSWIHDANGGNNVKSRAPRNEIYYNRIEGAYYHEIELIGAECCAEDLVREDSDVVGNLLIKKGATADFAVTRVGGDGTAQTWGRYRFVNNTVIVSGGAAVFRVFDGLESIEMHNNVLYRASGPVNVMRTVEAVWKNGPRIAGSNNWTTTGSTNVPTTWTGTLTGSSPGFTSAAGGDYSPATGSPLLNAGSGSPAGPPGYPFPNPLFPPAFQPPGTPGALGIPNARSIVGPIDIGAYEAASGPPGLTIDDRSVPSGGAANASFRVYLSSPSSQTVSVSYATSDGTALAGVDYSATSGTLTFSPGRRYHSIMVSILSTHGASATTFGVTLSNPANATLTDGSATGTITAAPAPASVPMYRAYNVSADYHFFTTSLAEKTNAVANGYRDESNPVPFRVPNTTDAISAAIFRMYNPNNGRHYYTASASERDSLRGVGWVYEKDEGFLYTTAQTGTVEVFRLYNTSSGVHLYTVKPGEKDAILAMFPGIWVEHSSLGFAQP